MEKRRQSQTPQGEVAQIIVEFLEVAITDIIFLKQIYPSGAFERRRYSNVVVHRARHPELREYIHSAVTGLVPFIQKISVKIFSIDRITFPSENFAQFYLVFISDGMIERVAVIFFNDENISVERFIFKLSVNLSYGSKVEETDLELSLRSFLVKLPLSESVTKVLPPGCRWEITAYFRSIPEGSTSKSAELWVPTDTKQWMQPPLITPLKSMNREPVSLQLYVEHPSLSEPKP